MGVSYVDRVGWIGPCLMEPFFDAVWLDLWNKACSCFFTISFSHLSPQSLIAHAMENGEKEKLDATAYCVAFTGVLGAGLTIFGAVVHFTNVRDIQDGLGIFALIIGILLYWFHVMHTLCKSKTSKYLYWIMSELDFQGYVKELQAAEPQIQWTIQNYHYETKRWKDKDGQEHEKKERVNTHRATTQYDIKGFVDETLSPEQMLAMFHLLYDGEQEDLESNKKKPIDQLFLLCEMPLEYHPTDDHEEQRLENEKQRFFQENTKDTHQDRHSANLISCHHKSHVMVVLREGTDNSHARPWWMNYWIFMLCTLLLLSVPYRVYFFSKCTKINWEVLKHFSHKPETVWSDDPKHSRSKRTDAASKAFRKVKRETPQRTVELPSAWEDPGKDSPDVGPPVQVPIGVPSYWKNQDLDKDFDEKIKLSNEDRGKIQKLMDLTFKNKATRDRTSDGMPTRLEVAQVVRMEDSKMWRRFEQKRAQLAAKGQDSKSNSKRSSILLLEATTLQGSQVAVAA